MVRLWRSGQSLPALPADTLELYLANRPEEGITDDTFSERRISLPAASSLSSTEALVKVMYLSCDPAMRVWLSPSRSYMPPVKVGSRMRALGVGEVVRPAGSLRVGDIVEGMLGWTEYAVMPADKLTKHQVPAGLSPSVMLGVLGITGMTAYFGLLDVGKVKKGDCVVVSAAAGATGSVVAQIAKNVFECKTIGIAGGPAKCRYLEEDLGIIAVDYKSEEGLDAGLKKALGGSRIDVYFDNVGGSTLEAALRRINLGARVVICGAISGYNKKTIQPGPYNYLNLISYRASMAGFLLGDYEKQFDTARHHLGKWLASGKISGREYEVTGLQKAPTALKQLFEGKNIGKVVVRVAPKLGDSKPFAAKL